MSASEKAYDVEQRLNQHLYQHRYTLPATASPSIGTSMTTATGLSASLDAGASYQFHALVLINALTSGGTLTYRMHAASGLTASNFRLAVVEIEAALVGADGVIGALDTSITGTTIGAGLADRIVTYDGYIDVSVAGTMSVQLALSAGSANLYRFGTALDVIQTA